MKDALSRREFLKTSAGVAVGAGLAVGRSLSAEARTQESVKLKKALIFSMLPRDLSLEDKFKLAKTVGFDGVEIAPADEVQGKEMRAAAEKAGVRIHSIIYGGWHAPLSSADHAVIERGLKDVQNALRCAKTVGADAVLLVPAVVNESTRYAEAYERSQKHIRSLIPLAKELGVIIAVENVWNKFLLSPIEFARYVDEFESPFVRAYFDVGNVVLFGFPQDWIRTLGKRIVKIHLKDFKRQTNQFVGLREGDVNWKDVRRALDEVGYTGFMTTELGGGDEAYLRDVSARVDKIVAGE
jgi:hexulose-6-phosphate isomerase